MWDHIILTLLLGLAALGLYIYFWRRGQFEESEDVKYQLFRDDKEE